MNARASKSLQEFASRVTALPRSRQLSLLATVVILAGVSFGLYERQQMYNLSATELKLVQGSTVDQKYIKAEGDKISYSRSEDQQNQKSKTVSLAASQMDSTGRAPYRAELATDHAGGMKFSDAQGSRSFQLKPLFDAGKLRYEDGKVVYPEGSSRKHVYTFRTNGVKEDIILSEAGTDTASYAWKLELGKELEARMLPDGGVGIYSANPYLFGDVQMSDDKSKALIDKARTAGEKTNLSFVLPAPYILEAGGARNYQDVSFTLDGSTLTLGAKNLRSMQYPLSIDPSVVVTTTADFQSNGSDDGGIDYSVADQISRKNVTSGATGGISTSYFNIPRTEHTSVATNGHLYIIGGRKGVSDTTCRTTGLAAGNTCNDIQRMPINADGSLGAIVTSYFNTPRYTHKAVAYNGYIYITGGYLNPSDVACKNTGAASVYCNDIQRIPLDPTTGAPDTANISTTYFNFQRGDHAVVATNGHLYIAGGYHNGTDTFCKNTGAAVNACNDIQRIPINADGSLGDQSTIATTYFNTPRDNHVVVATNDYIYVIGGQIPAAATTCKNTASDGACNDIQRIPINADGSLGDQSTITTSYFNYTRANHDAFAANGHLYVVGGRKPTSDTLCKNTGVAAGYCNDIQRMPINADGSLGAIVTSYYNTPRNEHEAVAANGYLFVAGGLLQTAATTCKDTGSTLYCNDIQRIELGVSELKSRATTYLNTPRHSLASAVYGDYLYIVGGLQEASSTTCKNTGVAKQECNDIQTIKINEDGSLGNITTSYFDTPRRLHSTSAHNGYLYIAGGHHATSDTTCKPTGATASNYCSDIQAIPLNAMTGVPDTANTTTTYLTTARYNHSAVVANGYLYIGGGLQATSNTACVNTGTATTHCNDIIRYTLNGNGSLTLAGTDYFNVPRYGHSFAANSNAFYIVSGYQIAFDTACNNTGNPSNYCNDIQRMTINQSNGSLGTVLGTTHFNVPRYEHDAVVANGYLYISGGFITSPATTCKNTATSEQPCNDIQRMKIASDGTLGPIVTSYFTVPRRAHTMAVWNNQIYLAGGLLGATATTCVNTATTTFCNDIQRLEEINKSAHSSLVNGGSNYFGIPRYDHASVIANGYLYVVGGYQSSSTTACKDTNVAGFYCNDIQRMAINSTTGTVGAPEVSYFTTPRYRSEVVASNGYLYIVGGGQSLSNTDCKNTGVAGTNCNDIQRFSINGSDGSLTYVDTNYFNQPRQGMTAAIDSGYLYIVGGDHGVSDTACKNTGVANSYCNDIQRRTVSGTDGSLGTQASVVTTYFATPRTNHEVVAANGYLYIMGGYQVAGDTACKNSGTNYYCNDIQSRQINPVDGSLGAVANYYFNVPRQDFGASISDGVLSIAGGFQPNEDTACVNTGAISYYCNDLQQMNVSATDGSLGSISTSYFDVPRYANTIDASAGYTYVIGGTIALSNQSCNNTGTNLVRCNDVQRMTPNRIHRASYEKTIDMGLLVPQMQTISYNGTSACGGAIIEFRVAGNDGIFGAVITISPATPGTQHAAFQSGVRYVWARITLDDSSCTTSNSTVTDISVSYYTPPSAPALIAPANGAIGTSAGPVFSMRSTDDPSYARYKIEVCSTADCSTILRTIDQTASQTGWSGQDVESGSAYALNTTLSGSTIATHTYQAPLLSNGTQYWWRAYAIDSGDSDTWSAVSETRSFTTQGIPAAPTLLAPGAGATGAGSPLQLLIASTDPDSDYLQYRIDLCSNNDCSDIVQTYDQSSSQSKWTLQNANNGTAYSSAPAIGDSQTAALTLRDPSLAAGTQFWWRAYAKDPAGTNTWSAASTIQTFTTTSGSAVITGGVTSPGGVRFGN